MDAGVLANNATDVSRWSCVVLCWRLVWGGVGRGRAARVMRDVDASRLRTRVRRRCRRAGYTLRRQRAPAIFVVSRVSISDLFSLPCCFARR